MAVIAANLVHPLTDHASILCAMKIVYVRVVVVVVVVVLVAAAPSPCCWSMAQHRVMLFLHEPQVVLGSSRVLIVAVCCVRDIPCTGGNAGTERQ